MKRHPELRFLAVALAVCAALAAHAARGEPIRPMTGAASPGEVLSRLQTAVTERQPKDYADCLADSFRFTPYAAVVASQPGVRWDRWDAAQEFQFVRWLCSPARKAELKLLDKVLERGIQSRGASEWEIIYMLDIDGTVFRGRATLRFAEIRQLWYLESWIDTRPEPWQGMIAPTSGEARAAYTR